jgi:hypothetical protein
MPGGMTHLDGDWMWRWFVMDKSGHIIATSTACFFNHEDAILALGNALRSFRSN